MQFIKIQESPPAKQGELFWAAYAAYDPEAGKYFPGSNLYMRSTISPPDFLQMISVTPVPDTVPEDLAQGPEHEIVPEPRMPLRIVPDSPIEPVSEERQIAETLMVEFPEERSTLEE